MRSKSIDTMKKIKSFAEEYYLIHDQSPTTAKIAERIGIARSTAYKYLVEMDRQGMISYDGQSIQTEVTKKSSPKVIRAAILGSVACGLPNLAEESIEEYVSLPVSLFGEGEFYLLRARGESMIDAGIEDGDLVVIRKQVCAKEGDIIVALVEGEGTLKRFYRDDDKQQIILHPENKAMADIYVNDCVIQGVAVKVIKNLN